MIQTFFEIGKAIQEDEQYQDLFAPWQNPFPKTEGANVVVVDIRDKKVNEVYFESFRSSYVSKYLYRQIKGARGTNHVPTLIINTAAPEKTFAKVFQSIDTYKHDFIDPEEHDNLKAKLENVSFESKQSYLITFRIDGKYFGEFELYRNLFYEEAYARYYDKVYGSAVAENYPCALTGEVGTVYGYVDTLGFTVNDRAFMRNGFDQSTAYKMFPVYADAIGTLEGAEKFISTELEKTFAGTIKYMLLPHLPGQSNPVLLREVIQAFKNKAALQLQLREDNSGTQGFINNTEDLIKEINENDLLNQPGIFYELLFIERNQAQLSLLLQLTDIAPSRIKKIYETKTGLQNRYARLTNIPPEKSKPGYNFTISLYRLKDFFLTEQGSKKYPHPLFYRITEAIFYGQNIDSRLVVREMLKDWRKRFKNKGKEYQFRSDVREGFIILEFLSQIGLFNHQHKIMTMQNDEVVALDAVSFIEQHPDFFDKDYKKGAFLFGCLVARLLYNQPGKAFLKELNGLNLDEQLINKKFPKLIDKLRKYKKQYSEMESLAARYLASGEKISKDEISMAVTTGMILQGDFDSKNKALKKLQEGVAEDLETEELGTEE